jgi:peptidyl-tRNA hydrolase
VAVRGDLSPGNQLAQAWHAGVDFAVKYPALTQHWHDTSNNVVIVNVPDETALLMLDSIAYSLGVKHHLTVEPDLDNSATAIALEPGRLARRMCAPYALALKEQVMT